MSIIKQFNNDSVIDDKTLETKVNTFIPKMIVASEELINHTLANDISGKTLQKKLKKVLTDVDVTPELIEITLDYFSLRTNEDNQLHVGMLLKELLQASHRSGYNDFHLNLLPFQIEPSICELRGVKDDCIKVRYHGTGTDLQLNGSKYVDLLLPDYITHPGMEYLSRCRITAQEFVTDAFDCLENSTIIVHGSADSSIKHPYKSTIEVHGDAHESLHFFQHSKIKVHGNVTDSFMGVKTRDEKRYHSTVEVLGDVKGSMDTCNGVKIIVHGDVKDSFRDIEGCKVYSPRKHILDYIWNRNSPFAGNQLYLMKNGKNTRVWPK